MKRSETLQNAVDRRLKVVQLLRKKNATNAEIQMVYGAKLMSTQYMSLLKQAVKQGEIQHPERLTPKELQAKLHGTKQTATVRKLHAVPSAVDKLAGLKRFLDEGMLPGMLKYIVGSDVQTVSITVTTDPAGNPTLSRRIGRAVTEWDEHTLDTRVEADNG